MAKKSKELARRKLATSDANRLLNEGSSEAMGSLGRLISDSNATTGNSRDASFDDLDATEEQE